MELRLPAEKLEKCRRAIASLLNRKSVTLRELQSVIGLLSFACKAIVPGRAFLRRVIDITIGVSQPFHHIKLTAAVKADLQVWLSFLDQFNGRCVFIADSFATPFVCHLHTDAAGARGYGALCGDEWFAGAWPAYLQACNITVLEFYPLVVALQVWGPDSATNR